MFEQIRICKHRSLIKVAFEIAHLEDLLDRDAILQLQSKTLMNKPHQTAAVTNVSGPVAGDIGLDWDLVSTSRLNTLVIGESETRAAFVDAIRRHLADPLVTVDCRDGLDLSSVPSQGTVVLSDVEELPLEDQQRLNAWLAAADHRPRVISTSRASLFPMIEAGMFVDSLYYRLNVVCFDATKVGGR